MKIAGRGMVLVAGIGILAAAAFAYVAHQPEIAPIARPDPSGFAPDLAEEGARLAGLGNCAVCHTRPGGAAYAGGLPIETPFGVIHSTNITPDPDTGIGAWSEDAFRRAMRLGVDRGGRHLYPAFPYDYFTRATDDDIGAIYAYLMTREAITSEALPNELGFPFNLRPLMAGWNLLFLKPGAHQADPAQDAEWNRGAYLVEGLGHCGACHSPRNALGAAAKTGPKALSGGTAEGWYVPPLDGTSPAPVPWTVDSLANYLIDGWDRDHGVAAGPMRPIVDDLYEQPEDEVVAMAVYLSSRMDRGMSDEEQDALRDEARALAERLDWGHPDAGPVPDDPLLQAGARVFEAQCAECHKASGKSAPLALSTVVHAPDAANFIEIVLHGIQPAPAGSPDRSMPARALQLSDDDLIALAAFARDRFTDRPAWTGVAQIVRQKRGPPPP